MRSSIRSWRGASTWAQRRFQITTSDSKISRLAKVRAVQSVASKIMYEPSASTQYAGYDPLTNSEDRRWNKIDNWCTLCKEPYGQWNEHRGKRDHICLEMFFDAILDVHRLHNPKTTWGAVDVFRRLTYQRLFQHHEKSQLRRRGEIFLLLKYLQDNGIIFLGPRKHGHPLFRNVGASPHGNSMMFKYCHQAILNVCPRADAKQIASLTQMCSCGYNLETVFDLCGMKDLVGQDDMPAAPLTGSAIPANSSEIPHYVKSRIVVCLFGQLRWAVEANMHPYPLRNPFAATCPEHLATVVEHLGHMLATELVFCRICEYVCRVEPVWRSAGAVSSDRKDARKLQTSVPLSFQHTSKFFAQESPDLHSALERAASLARMQREKMAMKAKLAGDKSETTLEETYASRLELSLTPTAQKLLREHGHVKRGYFELLESAGRKASSGDSSS